MILLAKLSPNLRNKVLLLKSLWDLTTKKDRLWIKWVNDYYMKGVNIMHIKVSSTASWMLSRIIDSRDLLSNWDDLEVCVKWEVQHQEGLYGQIDHPF